MLVVNVATVMVEYLAAGRGICSTAHRTTPKSQPCIHKQTLINHAIPKSPRLTSSLVPDPTKLRGHPSHEFKAITMLANLKWT
jgi:hypothetical protein